MATDPLGELKAIREMKESIPKWTRTNIEKAIAAGHSWPEIAVALGMSVQGAQKAAKWEPKN